MDENQENWDGFKVMTLFSRAFQLMRSLLLLLNINVASNNKRFPTSARKVRHCFTDKMLIKENLFFRQR